MIIAAATVGMKLFLGFFIAFFFVFPVIAYCARPPKWTTDAEILHERKRKDRE